MIKKFLAVGLLGLMSTTNAMAQSAFQGFYGQIGVGFEDDDLEFSGGTARGAPYTVPVDDQSKYVGVTASVGGYYALTPKFLLGAGIDYSPLSGKDTPYALSVPSAGVTINGMYKKTDQYSFYVSPALAIDEKKLAYVKVGYSKIDMKSTVNGSSETGTYSGYSIGLGYKQMISRGLYGFTEANYASYQSRDDGNGFSGDNKPTSYNLLFGLGYKF